MIGRLRTLFNHHYRENSEDWAIGGDGYFMPPRQFLNETHLKIVDKAGNIEQIYEWHFTFKNTMN